MDLEATQILMQNFLQVDVFMNILDLFSHGVILNF